MIRDIKIVDTSEQTQGGYDIIIEKSNNGFAIYKVDHGEIATIKGDLLIDGSVIKTHGCIRVLDHKFSRITDIDPKQTYYHF